MSVLETSARQDEFVRNIVLQVVQSLVDDREGISVELVSREAFSTLRVLASPVAIAVLIGTKGQMARALRTILAGYSAKVGRRYSLDLCESLAAESGLQS